MYEIELKDYYKKSTFDCISEESPYLIINHCIGSANRYYIAKIFKNTIFKKSLFCSNSKEETKIFMDLNGFNITEKIIVYYKKKPKIYFECFKLERI